VEEYIANNPAAYVFSSLRLPQTPRNSIGLTANEINVKKVTPKNLQSIALEGFGWILLSSA